MLQNLTGWHALIVLAIVLLVFGSTKLPALARSVGQSLRILKDETSDGPTVDSADPDGPPASAVSGAEDLTGHAGAPARLAAERGAS